MAVSLTTRVAIVCCMIVAVLATACAPLVRASGRCPTVYVLAADFALGAAALAYSVAVNQPLAMLPAGAVFLGANLAECPSRVRR